MAKLSPKTPKAKTTSASSMAKAGGGRPKDGAGSRGAGKKRFKITPPNVTTTSAASLASAKGGSVKDGKK